MAHTWLDPAWFAEIEPFPCSVLAHHYPQVPNLGDMTKIKKSVLQGRVEAPDVLVGGTPCQAFSVAGMREGLDDSRGQLTLEFVRLANAIDFIRSRRNQKPSIVVWENVPGVLNSKDNAFGCFLAGLAGEDSELQPSGKKWSNSGCVFGPERTIAWRVLDAQYFGLAQRRKRVFVVASARKDIDCTKILFERDSLQRNTPPSRQSQQDLAATIEASLGRSRGAGTPIGGLWWNGGDIADAITCTSNNQNMPDKGRLQAVATLASKQQALNTGDDIALTVCANDYKEPQVVCVHGTQDPNTNNNLAHTLGRNNGQENVVCCIGGQHPNAAVCSDGISPTLTNAMGEGGGHIPIINTVVAYPINTMTCQGRPSDDLKPRMGLGIGQENDPCPTLTKAHSHAVAYAFDSLSSNSMKSSSPHSGCRQTEIAKTLDTTVPCPSKNQGSIGVLQNNSEIAYGIPGNWIGRKPENGGNATEPPMELSPCLTKTDIHGVQTQMQVRRLTPKECERLQGFADNYTLVTHREKLATDSPRYKALGNSMAVPVMAWIGQRIQKAVAA